MNCRGCGKKDSIERRTSHPSSVVYERIRGIGFNRMTKEWVLDIEKIVTPCEPEITYQCSYCGKGYTKEQVINGYTES